MIAVGDAVLGLGRRAGHSCGGAGGAGRRRNGGSKSVSSPAGGVSKKNLLFSEISGAAGGRAAKGATSPRMASAIGLECDCKVRCASAARHREKGLVQKKIAELEAVKRAREGVAPSVAPDVAQCQFFQAGHCVSGALRLSTRRRRCVPASRRGA